MITNTQLLADTIFKIDPHHNPLGRIRQVTTEGGSAPFRKLKPSKIEAQITVPNLVQIIERMDKSSRAEEETLWHDAELMMRVFKKSLLAGSERTQMALLTAAEVHSQITANDTIFELATGSGAALKILLSALHSQDPVPNPTIVSFDYFPVSQVMAAIRMANIGQEVDLVNGLPDLSQYGHHVVLARENFDRLGEYPDNIAKLIMSDNGIIYVKESQEDTYEQLRDRFMTRVNMLYDKLVPGGRLAMSFLNIGFARKATFLDLPNAERLEAIKQILNPDYAGQLPLIFWGIGNGEKLRRDLLDLIPFTLDEVVDIFKHSRFGAVEKSFSTLAGMINICVVQKQ